MKPLTIRSISLSFLYFVTSHFLARCLEPYKESSSDQFKKASSPSKNTSISPMFCPSRSLLRIGKVVLTIFNMMAQGTAESKIVNILTGSDEGVHQGVHRGVLCIILIIRRRRGLNKFQNSRSITFVSHGKIQFHETPSMKTLHLVVWNFPTIVIAIH